MPNHRDETPCPCGQSKPYERCCGELHRGERQADSPEELMRSRYTAFVRGENAYLWGTLHPSHDDHARGRDAYCSTLRANAPTVRYRGLRVLDTTPEDRDGVAQVLFLAQIEHRGREASFVELSSFARQDGGWRYLMGTPLPRRGIPLEGLDCGSFRTLLERR